MINKVILVGNLGRDPELRSTPSGQPVASFTLATNRRWRDNQGEKHNQVEWHNIVVWGKLAKIAAKFLKKGKPIYLDGGLETRTWDDRETGEKKYRTQVVCEQLQMLGQRGSDFETGAGSDDEEAEESGFDEDAPF